MQHPILYKSVFCIKKFDISFFKIKILHFLLLQHMCFVLNNSFMIFNILIGRIILNYNYFILFFKIKKSEIDTY